MTRELVCPECLLLIYKHELVFHPDTGQPHHWQCLQIATERDQLEDEQTRVLWS